MSTQTANLPAEPRHPDEERRAMVRYHLHAEATCQSSANHDASWRALVHDVSALGVALEIPEKVAIGAILDVELENQQGSPVRWVLARVVHIEEKRPGSWLAGCAFVSELNESQLQIFQAYKIKPAAPDGRRWVRFPCNVETVCYTCETIPGERRPARILNISAGGIGLLVPCQFSSGALLHLELPAEAARLALIRIVRVVPHASGGWFHGCEFVDQLGSEELQDLVR